MERLAILSKNDLVDLLDITHNLCSVQSTDEFMQCYAKTKSLLLFDGGFAVYMDKEAVDKSQTPVFNYRAMNFPPEFIEKFMKKRVYLDCPIAKELLKTWEAQNWKTTLSRFLTKKKTSSLGLCQAYRFQDGWSHGCLHPRHNSFSVFSFTGSKVENDDRTRLILERIVPHFAECLKRITHGELARRKNKKIFKITPREIEVLKWLGNGKSTWEISVILNRSERVIFWHVDNLLKKLDAANRTQAVAIAMQHGLIE